MCKASSGKNQPGVGPRSSKYLPCSHAVFFREIKAISRGTNAYATPARAMTSVGSSRSFFCIVNEAAGGGRCGRRARAFLDQLQHDGFDLTIATTTAPGHATSLARAAYMDGKRQFLAVGGDGTAFEVLNGAFAAPNFASDLSLGLLPLGTGNSFLRDFRITTDQQALDALRSQRRSPCDVIRLHHRTGQLVYMNLLSMGLSAAVGAHANQHFKRFGLTGYAMALVARLVDLKHPVYPLRIDDAAPADTRPCTLLSFCNSQYTGGTMHMAPGANVCDGYLDIVRVGAFSRWQTLRSFPSIYRGTHVHQPGIEQTRAQRVTFEAMNEIDLMIDGEVVHLAPHSLEVVAGALEIFAA